MKSADRIGRARRCLTAAEDELQAAIYAAPESRSWLAAEVAELRRTQERLKAHRSDMLSTGFRRFLDLVRKVEEPS